MTKIYLAARYGRREEMIQYRTELTELGYTVMSRWINGSHQISKDGTPIGDNGEALVESGKTRDAALLREEFAQEDLEDVCRSNIMISFTEKPRATNSRGGRHVEFGYALALGLQMITVGHQENLFHWLPEVEHFDTWEDAKKHLSGLVVIQ